MSEEDKTTPTTEEEPKGGEGEEEVPKEEESTAHFEPVVSRLGGRALSCHFVLAIADCILIVCP